MWVTIEVPRYEAQKTRKTRFFCYCIEIHSLGHANISIFCIPLIDSGTVLEAGLFQANGTVQV